MTDDESERRVANALRVRAGRAVPSRAVRAPASRRATVGGAPSGVSLRAVLILALLGGTVLGMALALLSLLVPGALPPLG